MLEASQGSFRPSRLSVPFPPPAPPPTPTPRRAPSHPEHQEQFQPYNSPKPRCGLALITTLISDDATLSQKDGAANHVCSVAYIQSSSTYRVISREMQATIFLSRLNCSLTQIFCRPRQYTARAGLYLGRTSVEISDSSHGVKFGRIEILLQRTDN